MGWFILHKLMIVIGIFLVRYLCYRQRKYDPTRGLLEKLLKNSRLHLKQDWIRTNCLFLPMNKSIKNLKKFNQ